MTNSKVTNLETYRKEKRLVLDADLDAADQRLGEALLKEDPTEDTRNVHNMQTKFAEELCRAVGQRYGIRTSDVNLVPYSGTKVDDYAIFLATDKAGETYAIIAEIDGIRLKNYEACKKTEKLLKGSA